MARFINPLTDFGFKHLFGEENHKEFLIAFLNSLFSPCDRIVDLTYSPNESHRDRENDRAIIYDIHCRTADGRKLVVEMQNRYQANFRDRAIYYLASDIAKQGLKGQMWDYGIDGVVGVFFMNFDWKEDVCKDVIDEIGLLNKSTGKVFSDKMRMYFLKLPLVKEEASQCVTEIDKWLYLIKNLENMETMVFGDATRNDIFTRLAEAAELGNLTEGQRNYYERSLKALRDNYAVEKTARNEGIEEGIEIGEKRGEKRGRKEGRKEGIEIGEKRGFADAQRHNILNMRKMGMEDSMIARCLNISIEDINSYLS